MTFIRHNASMTSHGSGHYTDFSNFGGLTSFVCAKRHCSYCQSVSDVRHRASEDRIWLKLKLSKVNLHNKQSRKLAKKSSLIQAVICIYLYLYFMCIYIYIYLFIYLFNYYHSPVSFSYIFTYLFICFCIHVLSIRMSLRFISARRFNYFDVNYVRNGSLGRLICFLCNIERMPGRCLN